MNAILLLGAQQSNILAIVISVLNCHNTNTQASSHCNVEEEDCAWRNHVYLMGSIIFNMLGYMETYLSLRRDM